MKILFILEYYYPNIGGVEKLFKGLTESLVKEGHEVLVVTSRFDKDLPKEEMIGGVQIKRLNLSNRYLFTFFSVFYLSFIISKFDLVHTTSYNAALPAWIVAKLFRKKTIITFHEAWGKLWFQLPYLNRVQKFLFYSFEKMILFLNFNYYVAVSNYTKKRLMEEGIKEEKIYQIYNGLDKEDYKTPDVKLADPFTFTYFGRLGVSKGLDLIFPAAKKLIAQHPQIHIKLIIPKIPAAFFKRILKEIALYQLKEHVILKHNLSFNDLKKEIAKSNCVLIPSYSEGFCFAAVETSYIGRPIISSGLGALSETVSGKHILLKDQTSDYLLMAMEDALLEKYNYTSLKEFHINESIEKYRTLYYQILMPKN